MSGASYGDDRINSNEAINLNGFTTMVSVRRTAPVPFPSRPPRSRPRQFIYQRPSGQGDVLIARSQSLDRSFLSNFRGKEVLDSPKLWAPAATATSSNMTGQRLSLRADPVLTNLFAIVLHCPCGILPFHGAAVGYGRKFSMTQTSAPPSGSDGWHPGAPGAQLGRGRCSRLGGPPRFEVGETMMHPPTSNLAVSSIPHPSRCEGWGTRADLQRPSSPQLLLSQQVDQLAQVAGQIGLFRRIEHPVRHGFVAVDLFERGRQ